MDREPDWNNWSMGRWIRAKQPWNRQIEVECRQIEAEQKGVMVGREQRDVVEAFDLREQHASMRGSNNDQKQTHCGQFCLDYEL